MNSDNSLLLEVLTTLSSKEKKAFDHYIKSPFFNKNVRLVHLYQRLLDEQLFVSSREVLFTALFGNEPFNELKLNNDCSDLLQLLYGFLVHQYAINQPLQQQITLLECLIERNILKPSKRLTKKCQSIQGQIKTRSHHFYQEHLQFLEQQDRLALLDGRQQNQAYLQKMSDTLDVYFFCNKLRIACEMVSRTKLANQEYQPQLIEVILTTVENQPQLLEEVPALKIYYELYQLLTQPSLVQYQVLKDTVYEFQDILPNNELRDVCIYLLNFSVRQINYGKSAHYEEILNICDFLIQKDILLEHRQLTKWTFINVTTAGIRLKSFEWTEQFIKTYKPYLKAEERTNTVDYQLASLYFAKGDFDKTLKLLQQVEFTDTFYQASARVILLKVFYELNEVEPFFALTKSIKGVLRRKRHLSTYHRKSYNNFVRVVKGLYELRLLPKYQIKLKHTKIDQLLQELEPLTNKEWLQEKYELVLASCLI